MRLINFVDILKNSALRNCRQYSSIQIPKRVKRDNLSILKALSSVTKPDYLAPQYQYIDDPFLIPLSSIDKREYCMSYLSGKNAARYVMGRFPELFQQSTAYPAIKDFMPRTAPSLALDSVDGLKERIAMKLPIESYDSYRKLYDEGVEIPREVVDDLFDLLCFTNHEAIPQQMDLIEKHLKHELQKPFGGQGVEGSEEVESPFSSFYGKDSAPKKWKVNGAAENMFKDMEKQSSRNICSYIKGMVKFGAHDLAYEQYLKELQQNTHLDVSTFNAAISCINHLHMNPIESWESALDVLRNMCMKKVAPNTKTFNEVLGVLAKNEKFIDNSRDTMRDTLAEMNKCGLEPSLTTWLNVLKISYPTFNSKNNVLQNVIENLSESKITIQEPSDLEFFAEAMDICSRYLKDPRLGLMLNSIIKDNGFENLLGNSSAVTSYYSNYLILLGKYDTMENLYSEYARLTPHYYSTTFRVFDIMLDAIDDFASYEHIPKIWSDMVILRFSKRPDLLEKMLEIMTKVNVESELQQSLSKIADDVLKQYISGKSFGKSVPLTGNMLSCMIMVHLNSNNMEKCRGLLEVWQQNELKDTSLPSEESLHMLCRAYIKKNDYEMMHEVFKLIISYGYFSAEELLEEASSVMILTDEQKYALKNLL